MKQLLESIASEASREQVDERLGAGALLAAALVQIGREAQSLSQLAKAAPYGADASRRVEKARVLLEEQIREPLSIEQAAERVGWSADHLRRMFRVVLGKSPLEVQTTARMRRARHLLRHATVPIQEIALECGFDDPSHFARVFKKENGLSPRQHVMLAKYR